MKYSIYNEFINDTENDKIAYLFNTLREKYFILDIRLKELIIAGKDNISIIKESHPTLYKYLLLEKFIVPDYMDEVSECVLKLKKKFSTSTNLRITINPTLDCNLNCWYCYEKHLKNSCMTKSTIEALGHYIEYEIQNKNIKNIQLCFFGGEPLLKYKQVVRPVIQQYNEICLKYKKALKLHFTTNGVCLTHTVVNELKELSSEVAVQIAFDGNKDLHNSIKHFSNGKGCYDIVKKQLFYAIKKGLMITIRCNYTLSNFDSFRELIMEFKEFWHYPNVRFSFHKVWQEPESEALFAKRESLKQDILKFGIQSNIDSFWGDSLVPCYADFDNNIIVNYNGDIYKCTARDFNPEHRLGYLTSSGKIIYNDLATKRNKNRLTQKCLKCRILPICTICFQQRSEAKCDTCPSPHTSENASINISKYFYDVLALKRRQSGV